VLVVSSGGVLRHFFMAHHDTSEVQGMPGNGNCMTYVYEWEDGVFTCKEVYTADFSELDFGGLDGSGVPNRWEIDEEIMRRSLA